VNESANGAAAARSTAASSARRVFVIDDDEVILLSCRRILERAGYEVDTFQSGHAAIERIRALTPQLLLVDLKMPELDGFQVLERVRAIDPEIVVVVITGYATIPTAVDAMKAGAYDFLPKPFTPDELRLIAARSYERWRLTRESADLRREKGEAERRFGTFVSHQLKTPLVTVRQYLDVLLHRERATLPPSTLEWLERSQSRLGEALELIEDWLTLARIDRGALGQSSDRVDVGSVLAQVVKDATSQAETAGVTLSVVVPTLPCTVVCDEGAIAVVLSNLVSNAIKYNRRGGSVTVELGGDGGMVEIAVRDTGIGIPAASIPSLFLEFSRVGGPETAEIPGTGLGLAICKRLLNALGGSIGVSSKHNQGSVFVVRLPSERPPHEGPA
jgi:two-component system, sensor histidine kinase and response regulator